MTTRAPSSWRFVAAVVVALALGGAARPAAAQDLEVPRPRQGYFVSLGLAAAVADVREHGAGSGAWNGSGLALRLGQMVTRRFGLGLTFASGGAKKGTETAALYGLGLEAQWEVARNLALRGGSGLGVVSITDAADPMAGRRGNYGAAFSLGASYDWFPGKGGKSGGFAVTPVLELRLLPGTTTTTLAGFLGVELAYWTGLPRNQLQLPDSEAYEVD